MLFAILIALNVSGQESEKLDTIKLDTTKVEVTEDTLHPVIEKIDNSSSIEESYNKGNAFPVIIKKDTVYTIFEKAKSNSVSTQAVLCADRIRDVLKRDIYIRDSIKVVDSAEYLVLKYAGTTLVEFSDTTATVSGASKSEYTIYLTESLTTYLESNQKEGLLDKLIKVVIYLVIYILMLFLLKFLHKKARNWVVNNELAIFSMLEKMNIHRVKEEDKEKVEKNLLYLIKWINRVFVLFISYLMLPAILSVFYYTQSIGEKLFGYVLNPLMRSVDAVSSFIPNLFEIIVIVFLFKGLLKLVNYFFEEIESGHIHISGFYQDWAQPTSNIVKIILYIFLITIIFPLLPGAESDAFKGISVFVGVLLSMGSTSVVSNALSGLVMTYMRPFNVGDRISTDSVTGVVIQKNILVTRIRTPKNVIVTIPNSKILSGHSENYSKSALISNLIIHGGVTIGYDVDWRIVHKLLIDAAKNTDGLVNTKEPFVLQTSLDDFYVAYEINAYTNNASNYINTKSELFKNILEQFNTAGVEILSPHYRANRSGRDTAIPDNEE